MAARARHSHFKCEGRAARGFAGRSQHHREGELPRPIEDRRSPEEARLGMERSSTVATCHLRPHHSLVAPTPSHGPGTRHRRRAGAQNRAAGHRRHDASDRGGGHGCCHAMVDEHGVATHGRGRARRPRENAAPQPLEGAYGPAQKRRPTIACGTIWREIDFPGG